MRLAQGLGELGADVVSVPVVAEAQLRQPLGADHVPHPVERSDNRCGIGTHVDPTGVPARVAADTGSDQVHAGYSAPATAPIR